jgi:hypothetical protein
LASDLRTPANTELWPAALQSETAFCGVLSRQSQLHVYGQDMLRGRGGKRNPAPDLAACVPPHPNAQELIAALQPLP